MSFTKKTVLDYILAPAQDIQNKTIQDNDLVDMLDCLNTLIIIKEYLVENNRESFEKMWNEIINDAISAMYCSISGFYHIAQISLRSILEIASSSFFYYDHRIEYYLFTEKDEEATIISSLINDHKFYTTKYIKSFYVDIEAIQTKNDSVSTELSGLYRKLSNVVHGRFSTLTKKEDLIIEYSKEHFRQFEDYYVKVLGIIAVMFVLRFTGEGKEINPSIISLARKRSVVNL